MLQLRNDSAGLGDRYGQFDCRHHDRTSEAHIKRALDANGDTETGSGGDRGSGDDAGTDPDSSTDSDTYTGTDSDTYTGTDSDPHSATDRGAINADGCADRKADRCEHLWRGSQSVGLYVLQRILHNRATFELLLVLQLHRVVLERRRLRDAVHG